MQCATPRRGAIIGLAAVLWLAASSNALAQEEGRIAGTVSDAATGRPIADAGIELAGTQVRIATDLAGRFRTQSLAAGVYTLQVSMLGYTTLRVDSVRVTAGDVTTLPLVLEPTAIELEEVVATVTTQRAATDAGLLAIRRNAAVVMDGISAEEISRSPDSNAADAIARVTGVSVVDDKFVVVRGLTERYSNTLLNGVELASPEPTRRIVPLDIFPASLLESITTVKAATPDLPGDFVAGSVNIQTKDFPEERVLELDVSQGYNSLTTFDRVPVLPRNGLGDMLGFDGNDRFRRPEDFEDDNALARSIRRDWTPAPRTVLPDFGLSFQYGDQVGTFEHALGYIISVDYGFKTSYDPAERFAFVNSVGQTIIETETEHATTTADWGLVANAALRLGQSHTLGIRNLITRESEEFVIPFQLAFEAEREQFGPLTERHQVRYIERGLLQTQLRGQHRFTAPFSTLWNWNLTVSHANRDEPENRTLTYADPQGGAPMALAFAKPDNPYWFRFLDDRTYVANVDLSVPLESWFAGEALLKTGISGRWKDRDFDADAFRLTPAVNGVPSSGTPVDGQEVLELPPELVTAPEQIGRNLVARPFGEFGLPYTSDDAVRSAYIMADVPLLLGARAVGGVRLEQWDLELINEDAEGDPSSVTERDEQDLLWSVNLTLPLNDQMNLRAAGFRSISRPDAREIALSLALPVAGRCEEGGNPDLNRAEAINGDLRWEWYPAPGELISLTGFYKQFTGAIVQSITVQEVDKCRVRHRNTRTAYVRGGEVELRKELGFLHSALEDLTLGFNFTYSDGGAELILRETLFDLALQDLSKYVANASLSYSNTDADLTATVLYNYFDDRLSLYGDIDGNNNKTPDIIEQGRGTLGFKVTKGFRGITASLSGNNLTNEVVRESQETDAGVFPVGFARPGVSLSLSLGYAF
ncbi:MAG: TonB-dependent receptor domain-containing protein [Longimicrobiales bacterium]